jgi:hypothetical protein
MLKLYFNNANDENKFVANLENFSDFFDVIEKDIHKRNPDYKVPYYRTWVENGIMNVDVGSHTEFYILKSDKDDMLKLWNKHLDGGK